jgi:hypothetical protein
MEFVQKNITPHTVKKTLDIETVIDLLVLFSGIWFLEGKLWKATKALFSAGRLRLDRIYYGQRVVLLSKRMGAEGLENEAEFTQLARSIFADLSKFHFCPFVQRTVDEMVSNANSLFSYYMLKKRRNDVAGTTRH